MFRVQGCTDSHAPQGNGREVRNVFDYRGSLDIADTHRL